MNRFQTQAEQDAYNDGYATIMDVKMSGQTGKSNPHSNGSPEYVAWEMGADDGGDDA